MWKKGVLFILTSATLFWGLSERVEQLEKEMKEIGTQNTMGTFGLSMKTAQPAVGTLDWYLTGEILYWDTKLGRTEYVFSSGEAQNIPNPPIHGSVRSNSFGWEFDGRFGLGKIISRMP